MYETPWQAANVAAPVSGGASCRASQGVLVTEVGAHDVQAPFPGVLRN